jgi:hypothetical protein
METLLNTERSRKFPQVRKTVSDMTRKFSGKTSIRFFVKDYEIEGKKPGLTSSISASSQEAQAIPNTFWVKYYHTDLLTCGQLAYR